MNGWRKTDAADMDVGLLSFRMWILVTCYEKDVGFWDEDTGFMGERAFIVL
jgi:hypothetical protein